MIPRYVMSSLALVSACQCGQSRVEEVPADMPKKAVIKAIEIEGGPQGLDPGDPGDRTTFQPWDGGTPAQPDVAAAPGSEQASNPLANWKFFDPPLPLTSTVWTPPRTSPAGEYRPEDMVRKPK